MVSYLWRNNLLRRHRRLRPGLPRCQTKSGIEPAATSPQSRKVLSKLKNKFVSSLFENGSSLYSTFVIFEPKKFISVWIYSVSWTKRSEKRPSLTLSLSSILHTVNILVKKLMTFMKSLIYKNRLILPELWVSLVLNASSKANSSLRSFRWLLWTPRA